MPLSMDFVLSRMGSFAEKTRLISELLSQQHGGKPGTTDLTTLEICFQLLESARVQSSREGSEPKPSESPSTIFDSLCRALLSNVIYGENDTEAFLKIAALCADNEERTQWILMNSEEFLSNSMWILVEAKEGGLLASCEGFLDRYLLINSNQIQGEFAFSSLDERISGMVRCLDFVKHFFGIFSLSRTRLPFRLVTCLIGLIGGTGDLANSSHHALSALMPTLDLLEMSHPGEDLDTSLLFSEQLWNMICALLADSSKFETSGSVFKLWFQWLYQAGKYGPRQEHLQDEKYWRMLQMGARYGFSEQRKYCLGILQCSLSKTTSEINTACMTVAVSKRQSLEMQYEKYCTLFEAIVLDRYANQVEAALGDLSTLMAESDVHPAWMTTMLSSALDSKVQDGLRKIIGRWYIDFIIQRRSSVLGQSDFVFQGFLPWATQGQLFTSSLSASRDHTTCAHGSALSKVMETFVTQINSIPERPGFLRKALEFVLDRRRKIFAYSTLYLLEGLLEGVKASGSLGSLKYNDLDLVLQVSRRTGLPEIARDLCNILCMQFFEEVGPMTTSQVPGYEKLSSTIKELNKASASAADSTTLEETLTDLLIDRPVEALVKNIQESNYRSIQGAGLIEACTFFYKSLEHREFSVSASNLLTLLAALWDEADTQEFPRRVTNLLPAIFFHPRCVEVCLGDTEDTEALRELLSKVLVTLHQFAEGRSWLLATLASAIRKACLTYPQSLTIFPMEDFLVRLAAQPPAAKDEFLFEVIAAEKLATHLPHRTYTSYYGKREWHGYANIIDLLNKFPKDQLDVAQRVMDRILAPWASQKPNVPIMSKWKEAFQLQVLLLLTEACVETIEPEAYLRKYWHALTIDSWPRYRFLLEWIVARIYKHYPHLTQRDLLPNLTDAAVAAASPRLVATWIKLSVVFALFSDDAEDFTLQLMTLLIPLSALQKVQIRFEAHWSVPIVWDLAERKRWKSILDNPAFRALNNHIRGLAQYESPATSTRRLKLDLLHDHTLAHIFQGEHMRMDQPEPEKVSYDDFIDLNAEDEQEGFFTPPARILLGDRLPKSSVQSNEPKVMRIAAGPGAYENTAEAPLQTKSGTLISSLTPRPEFQKRPTTLIVVASLIDNPTNLGGLSRISEIFGVEALYIRSLDALNSKDFLSTAVTSHKHFPILPLTVSDMPAWLAGKKNEGYTVVCIEQTDRSSVLGEDDDDTAGLRGGEKRVLPKKCVLILGSEREGINREVLVCADKCVEIRQVGVTRSLNVQTAGGIVVWEWWREWRKEVLDI